MFKFCFVLIRTMFLIVFFIGPAGSIQIQTAPTGDPFFTVSGITYGFSAGDCDPLTAGDQPCTNPIQASVDFLSGTAATSPWFGTGATPDDGDIHVEAGTYAEDISVDGAAGWAFGANRPVHLGIKGSGLGSSILDGGFVFSNMNDLTLSGFLLKDVDMSGNTASIAAHDNAGTLELSDIVVVSIDPGLNRTDQIGDGIYVIDHSGDIHLTNIEASNNSETGAWLDNRAGLGGISIESSNFNANMTGLIAQSNGDISLTDVSASDNLMAGVSASNCNETGLVCSGTGNISVTSSLFNNNNQPGVTTSHTRGLVAESNGEIHLSQVTADSNDNDGALLVNYFEGSTGAIRVERSEFHENGQGEIGSGLDVRSRGEVSIVDVDSQRNLEYGVDVYNGFGGAIADIHARRGQFNENGLSGMRLASNGDTDIVGVSINGNATLGDRIKALEVNSSGDIRVSDVVVDDNHGWGAALDNTAGTGAIAIGTSEFNRNQGCGLCANANGNITFIRVTASRNGMSGANADNCRPSGFFTCAGTGRVEVRASEFNNNGPVGVSTPHWVGFVAYSNGDILLTNVSASSNNYHGAVIFNHFDGSTGSIIVRRSEFNDNGTGGELGHGLKIESMGDIQLLDVTASQNLEKGIEGVNTRPGATGDITVRSGQFRKNGWAAFDLESHGPINIFGVLLADNDAGGIFREGSYLISPKKITMSCSIVLNHPIGLWVDAPQLLLAGVLFAGNDVNYTSTGLVIIRRGCA